LALPGKRDGIHGLLELAIFGLAQKTSDIQKDDEAPLELADSRDVVGFAVRKNGARSFDFGRRDLEHFRGGTDNQAEELVSSSTTRMRFFLSGWAGAAPKRLRRSITG